MSLVTRYAQTACGAQCLEFQIRGIRVQVQPRTGDEQAAAEELAKELAAMSAPAAPVDAFAICVALDARGVYLLPRVSVGHYTPAVAPASGHGWVVLDSRGAALVLTHDSFEAARWALCLDGEGTYYEDGDLAELATHPVLVASDDELSREANDERCRWLA